MKRNFKELPLNSALELLKVLPQSQTQHECWQRVGDTSEINSVPRLDFRCGSTKTTYTEIHYMHDMDPFPRYCHIIV